MNRLPPGGADLDADFDAFFARSPRVRNLPHREAWVLRTVTNLAIDAARRSRAPGSRVVQRIDPAELVALRVTLVEALRALPRRQREAMVLRYLADFPEGEVCAALGVRVGTVKSHLNRGRAALRDQLAVPLEQIGHEPNPA
ncbi:MAG: sigma-70 family RNA polymerase sigma factor [Acidimicrobiales bacterium]